MTSVSAGAGGEPKVRCQQGVGVETRGMREQRACELDRRIAREESETLLDEALNESFPASEPVAITAQRHHSR